jgi:nitrite reductase/ring-hydroxylating ferredoxin subunit
MIEALSTAGWVRVASLAEVPPGSVKAVRCAGDRVVALVNVDGVISALDNTCPHRGGPLAGGKLVDGELACPWHGFRFDPRTGAPTMPTLHPPASVLDVRVEGDDVQIRL